MRKISIENIVKYTNGNLLKKGDESFVERICIDNREAKEKDLFIPIIGEVHDGHKFMEGAYENGVRTFLIDEKHSFEKDDINLISVKDTTLALGDLSKGYKETFDIPFIAVTGSVGKTSTKDIIYSVISTKYKALKTKENFNNNIGLPRTLLSLEDEEMAIIEMGMDHKGELDYLSNLVNPDIAVITNIGQSHIMNFEDGQDGIFKAKMEITNGLKNNGTLIINGDDKYLRTLKEQNYDYKLITCGFEEDNDIYCKSYELINDSMKFIAVYNGEEHEFVIGSPAKHNVLNSLFAIAIANIYNIEEESIRKGLNDFKLSSNRLDVIKTDKYTIINDTYNASYDSMKSALEVLNNYDTRKVAILGDILELGDYSEEIHRNVGKLITCDLLITIGEDSKYINEEVNIENYHFDTKEEFYEKESELLKDGDTILVKASHGIGLLEVVEYLQK